jgi:ABC-type cobalt transport system substrate-binding protein
MLRKLTTIMIIAVALVSVLFTIVVAAEVEGTVSAVDDKGMATIKATDGKEYKAQIAGVKVGDKVDGHVEGGKTSCHKLGKTHK